MIGGKKVNITHIPHLSMEASKNSFTPRLEPSSSISSRPASAKLGTALLQHYHKSFKENPSKLGYELIEMKRTQKRAFIRRASEYDDVFNVKETRSKSFFDVSASFYIKRRTNLAFIASFYINKQLIQYLYNNTHTHTHFSFLKGGFQ